MLHLDHVAIGVSNAIPALRRLAGEMGGTLIGGGVPAGAGFRALQVHLGTPDDVGMTVELLEPWQEENNDFLARFLASRGDGPHHITLKTDNIERELERLRALGVEPIGIDLSRHRWQEMFLHPKDAHGVVVQIAQSSKRHPAMAERVEQARKRPPVEDDDRWWGDADTRSDDAVVLRRVVMTSPEDKVTRRFFSEVLGGTAAGTEIRWPGGVIDVRPGAERGVSHLEVEAGVDATVGGTRFVGG